MEPLRAYFFADPRREELLRGVERFLSFSCHGLPPGLEHALLRRDEAPLQLHVLGLEVLDKAVQLTQLGPSGVFCFSLSSFAKKGNLRSFHWKLL